MLFMRVGGGLGNQMFQYAFAKAYSLKNNRTFFLDITALEEHSTLHSTKRKFKLEEFKISLVATKNIPFWAKHYSNRIFRKIHDFIFSFYILKDDECGFNKDYFKNYSIKIFDGYFQSPKYFEEYRTILLDEFTLKTGPRKELAILISNYQEHDSVAIHIRRGDYLLAKNASIHGVLDLNYYSNAINEMKQRFPLAKFYIFSDDIKWCKSIWENQSNFSFISPDLKLSDFEEMMLMSSCKHQIIANSSFSWWGAWLNKNPEKVIIAPKNWFIDKTKQKNWDIYPNNWLTL